MKYITKSVSADAVVHAQVDDDGNETGHYIYDLWNGRMQVNAAEYTKNETDAEYTVIPTAPDELDALRANLSEQQEERVSKYRNFIAGGVGAVATLMVLLMAGLLTGHLL